MATSAATCLPVRAVQHRQVDRRHPAAGQFAGGGALPARAAARASLGRHLGFTLRRADATRIADVAEKAVASSLSSLKIAPDEVSVFAGADHRYKRGSAAIP
jgi:hypothetical protein